MAAVVKPALDDPAEWTTILVNFLRRTIEAAGAKGIAVGMSGGIDSAVVAALGGRAFGAKGVLPVIMPAPESDPNDAVDAERLCSHLGLKPIQRSVAGVVEQLEATVGTLSPAAAAGVRARARMMMLYGIAQTKDLLVCGTGNKSELLLGYFTKYGDGGVDLQPLGDLYKTQVWRLAEHLGLPKWSVEKVPTAGLRRGQTDEKDLGMPYRDLDRILKGFELNQGIDEVAERTGIDAKEVARIETMVRRSEHKRRTPLVPKLGARTVGLDWRRSVQWDS